MTVPGGWSGAGSVRATRRRQGKPGSRALRSLFSSLMLLACFPPFLLVRRRIGWFLPAPSLARPGAGVRLVSAQAGEEQTWRCRKVCAPRARRAAAETAASGAASLSEAQLEPQRSGSRGAEPRSSASFADNSFVHGSLHPPPPGCGRAGTTPRLPDWPVRCLWG